MIETGLFQLITTDSNVISLVGVDANGTAKAYWVLAPGKTTVPYIILERVSTKDTYSFAGDEGFRETLFQIDCYATDYYTAVAISDAVRSLLSAYRGNLPDSNSTAVQAVLITKDWDMPYEEGSIKGFVFRKMLEIRVIYNETPLEVLAGPDESLTIDGGS